MLLFYRKIRVLLIRFFKIRWDNDEKYVCDHIKHFKYEVLPHNIKLGPAQRSSRKFCMQAIFGMNEMPLPSDFINEKVGPFKMLCRCLYMSVSSRCL